MNDSRIPPLGRKIWKAKPIDLSAYLDLPENKEFRETPIIERPTDEKMRIIKRLEVLAAEHILFAERVGIKLCKEDFRTVFGALRQHAKLGKAEPFDSARDEIHLYVLDTMFDEFVEEPSNILYTTRTGEDTMRYDAMHPDFWIECLDLLESKLLLRLPS